MRGTITMSHKEYKKAYLWLWGQYQKAIKDIDTYKRDSLSSLKGKEEIGNMRMFDWGVTATRLLSNKYRLKGYKDQNYGIKII